MDAQLFKAVSEGRTPEVRALVADGASVAARDEATKSTPLHWSAGNGHFQMTRVLLELGAPVNARNAKGETALHHASQVDRIKVGCLLIDHGADVFAKDKNGQTPVSRSVAATEHMAKTLLQHKQEQDHWAQQNERLIAVVGMKNRLKVEKLVHDQNETFAARLRQQKMEIQASQEMAFQTIHSTTQQLQGRIDHLEQHQQQGETGRRVDDDTLLDQEPPAKRQKSSWDGSNNKNEEYSQRVVSCEQQLQEQRAEMAALRKMIMMSGGTPRPPRLAAPSKKTTTTTMMTENTPSSTNVKVEMEEETSLGNASIMMNAPAEEKLAVTNEHHQTSDAVLLMAMEQELERVRAELEKSQEKARRYKVQRDDYKMERDHYKKKMEQLHELTSQD